MTLTHWREKEDQTFDNLIDDFASGVYHEGDPKWTKGTTAKDLIAYIHSREERLLKDFIDNTKVEEMDTIETTGRNTPIYHQAHNDALKVVSHSQQSYITK